MRTKKFTLLTLALLMMSVVSFAQKAPTAATQTLLQKTMRVSNVQAQEFGAFQFNMPFGKIDTQSSRMLNPNLFKMSTAMAANHRSLRAESDYSIIYDQPEGELKTYDRFGGYYILDGSSVYYDDQSGSIDIVWGTDGKVYFKDILSGLPIGTWVYGELSSDGTTITVPLNQNLIYISDYDCCLAIRLINYASGVGFTVDTETASVVFTVDGDLISMQGTGLASVSLGAIWTDDLSISDLGDYETVYALQAPKETIDVDKAVFYDDFESGDLAKWTLYTQGEGEGWYDSDLSQFSVSAYSGSFVASSWSWNGGAFNADNWLVTPKVALGGTMSFWVYTNKLYPDSYEVLLSTTGNATTDFTVVLQEKAPAPTNGVWNKVTIDLSAYAGQEGYIAIHHQDYDENYLFIDDFVIYPAEGPSAPGLPIWKSDESVEVNWGTPIKIEANNDNLAGAKVGDIIHVFAEVASPGDLWSVQVAIKDGAWTDLEAGLPIGNVSETDAQFVITGDILKYIQANGLLISGGSYTTKLVTLETTETTGSENSVWIGNSTEAVTVNANHFKNAHDKAGVQAGDKIRVTSTGSCDWKILMYSGNDTGWSWTLYEGVNAVDVEGGFEFEVTDAIVEQLKIDGCIVHHAAGLTITQIELIPYEGPQYVDVNVDMDSSMSITDGLNAILQGKPAGNVNISLKSGEQYTIEAPIEASGKVTINGKGATIDASALTGPFVNLAAEPVVEANEAGGYPIEEIAFVDVTINNLSQSLVKSNNTYLVGMVLVDNSVIGIKGAAKKTIFDFSGATGGNVVNLSIVNSTLWADDATEWQNGGFFSTQSGKEVTELGGTSQVFFISNSTLYNIAKGKTTSTLRKNSQDYQYFVVTNNIIANSGKSGQFLKGLNSGQAGKPVNWVAVYNNTFFFDGVDVEETCGGEITGTVLGDPGFKDAANGDFTLGDQAMQQLSRNGDPRWLGMYKPESVTAAIELTPLDGADLTYDLAEAYKVTGYAPAYITLNLRPGAHYTVSQPMEINATINIIGDESDPALIDLSHCSGPMVQYSSALAPAFTVNDLGFYEEPFNVVFKNVIFSQATEPLFYANKQKYLVEYFTFENCIAEYLHSSKTIFDFNGGGVVENFTINNSTIYGNSNDGMKHTGFLYSSQSGDKATAAGLAEQKFNITNSTLYNIANGKNVMNHRQNGQKWLTFTVKNNVIFNCGKKGQFCQGLNGGQDSENPQFFVHYNSFMWYDGAVLADVDDTCGSKNPNEVTASWKNTYPENAVTDIFPKFFWTDEIGQYNNFFRGNFSVAEGSVQKANSVGDPRWLKYNGYTDVKGINAEKADEGAWYTIQGVRVDQPTKGLYIHNGKKVMVK